MYLLTSLLTWSRNNVFNRSTASMIATKGYELVDERQCHTCFQLENDMVNYFGPISTPWFGFHPHHCCCQPHPIPGITLTITIIVSPSPPGRPKICAHVFSWQITLAVSYIVVSKSHTMTQQQCIIMQYNYWMIQLCHNNTFFSVLHKTTNRQSINMSTISICD